MLDYTKPTPPLSPSCVALAERFNGTFMAFGLDEGNGAALKGTEKMEPSADVSTSMETSHKTVDTDANQSGSQSNASEDPGSGVDTKQSMLPLNQLTINEYWPGQGIASHTG